MGLRLPTAAPVAGSSPGALGATPARRRSGAGAGGGLRLPAPPALAPSNINIGAAKRLLDAAGNVPFPTLERDF